MDVHGLYTEVLVRWMERIADGQPPLIFGDGQQTMDFVYTSDIARANILAATSDVSEGVYNIASGEETSLLGLAEALLRVMGSDLGGRARSGARRQRRRPPARRHLRRPRGPRLPSPRSGSRRACASWSSGGAPLREEIAAGRELWRRRTAVSRINVMQPWLGEEEVDAVAEVHPLRLGRPGSAGRRVRGGASPRPSRPSTPWPRPAARRPCTWRSSWPVWGAGDDVVVPSFSFIATANAADVRRRPAGVRGRRPGHRQRHRRDRRARRSPPRTRAVIVVDQGGVPVDLDPIRALCDPRGIVVVEDAACGAGSTYRGRPVGAGAEIAAWSFHPRKILTTGEGGMLTTSRPDWAARARRLREHAMSVSAADRHASVLAPPEEYLEIGLQLPDDRPAGRGRAGAARQARRDGRPAPRAGRGYAKAIAEIDGLRAVADPACGHLQLPVVLGGGACPAIRLDREGLMARLAEAGDLGPPRDHGRHRQPAYAVGHRRTTRLPVTERLTDHTLILPLFHQISESEQARVVDVLWHGEHR